MISMVAILSLGIVGGFIFWFVFYPLSAYEYTAKPGYIRVKTRPENIFFMGMPAYNCYSHYYFKRMWVAKLYCLYTGATLAEDNKENANGLIRKETP